jgi:hypothetical protein
MQQVAMTADGDDKHPPFYLTQEGHLLQGSHFVKWDRVARFSLAQYLVLVHLDNSNSVVHTG